MSKCIEQYQHQRIMQNQLHNMTSTCRASEDLKRLGYFNSTKARQQNGNCEKLCVFTKTDSKL